MAHVFAMGISPSVFNGADALHTTDFFSDQAARV
jgi:hypothetical protein